jgi:hypothetical protein
MPKDPVKDLYQRWSEDSGAGRSPDADEAVRRLAEWARPKLGL